MSRRGTTAVGALLLALAGVLLCAAPADARPYGHGHHHHGWYGPGRVGHGWYGPGWHRPGWYGPGVVYRYRPRCWTEWRTVRIHTDYGVVWRERPVRRCR